MSARAVLEEKLTAPVKKGDVVGTITLYEGDEPVGTYDAVAMQSVAEGGLLSYFGIEDATAKVIRNIILALLAVLFVVLVVYVLVMRRKTKIKKARKAAKMKAKEREESVRRAEWERYYEGSKYRSGDGTEEDR